MHLFGSYEMKVVVTGGAGFIGANLVRALRIAEPEWQVAVIDNLSTGFRTNLEGVDDVILYEASILDNIALDAAFENADSVVHLAARPSVQRSVVDPLTSHEINATGTVRVLEAARLAGVGHIVVASSSSVYGATRQLPKHEELAVAPLSPYAASKLATEAYALAYGYCNHVPVLAFRFFNVFGPLQPAGHAYAAAIPAFMAAALKGRPIPIFGDGLQTRDFTFVGSLCAVVVDAVRRKVASDRPVNLAFGTRRTLLEVIDELSDVLGRPLERTHAGARPGDVRDSQADQTRLRALFPDIQPVDFRAGLEATVRWFHADQQRRVITVPELAHR
jgi:UDP-glucose 4-epimerase